MTPAHRRPLALPLVALVVGVLAGPAAAGEIGGWLRRTVAAPLQAGHRLPPPPATDPCVADLAARIAWLEHHLDAYGSIVAKQPDVWGQSRLTRHRVECEQQLERQLGMFSERTSAAIRRSDQAFLGLALAMQSASGRRRAASDVPVPDVTTSNSVVTSIQGLLPTTNEAAGRADPVVIARTAPFAAVAASRPALPLPQPPEPAAADQRGRRHGRRAGIRPEPGPHPRLDPARRPHPPGLRRRDHRHRRAAARHGSAARHVSRPGDQRPGGRDRSGVDLVRQ
jgi:hypothetical protein